MQILLKAHCFLTQLLYLSLALLSFRGGMEAQRFFLCFSIIGNNKAGCHGNPGGTQHFMEENHDSLALKWPSYPESSASPLIRHGHFTKQNFPVGL